MAGVPYLKGVRIFLIPNNTKSNIRQACIDRALRQAATWSREFDDSVTHVVLDESITPAPAYLDLIPALGGLKLDIDQVLVPLTWLRDSILLRRRVNETNSRYRIKASHDDGKHMVAWHRYNNLDIETPRQKLERVMKETAAIENGVKIISQRKNAVYGKEGTYTTWEDNETDESETDSDA